MNDYSITDGPHGSAIGKRRATEIVNGYWLDHRRDRITDIWMIAWYDRQRGTVMYKSTSTRDLVEAKRIFYAFVKGDTSQLPSVAAPVKPPLSTYFVGGSVGAIKIGASSNPHGRLATFRRQSPIELNLLAVALGGKDLEREYHQRFAAHRMHGEWFSRHPDILAEINRLNSLTNDEGQVRHG